ncbi:MAG TPA: TonB-dependent receptor, partial [Flavisolibacter sp.]|nr:TonB-dependent receptor [Flavisolibacter sp.]
QENHTEKVQSDNQLVYRQQFTKKNRLLITTLRYGIIEDKQNGIVQTHTDFYEGGAIDSVDIADQQKRMTGNSRTLGAKITFSEPLSLKWSLVLDYAFNKNNSESHRNTFNKDATGKYASLDQEFSNNFDLNVFSHSGTTILKFTDKKLRAAFGSGVSTVKLKLFNLDNTSRNNYNFLNLTPQASVNYTIKPQTNIRLNYRGTTRQPTIDQLQPIRDNADRLNIFVGNPDLKVGFNHSLNIGFNTYKTLSQKGLFTNFGYNIPVNSITFLTTLDVSRGKQTYTPVNVNGSRSWYFYADYFKDGGEKKLGYSFNMRGNGGKNINFINEKRNSTSYLSSDFGFALRYNNPDKFSFEINPRAGYNISESSLMPELKNNYWNYGGSTEATITLPGNIELSSNINFDLRQNLAAFAGNPNQTIWNASLSKKVFKDKSGRIYFIANDLLDKNRGFNRNITSNFISEDRYSRISRYFLLKFEWSLSKMPGQNK